MVNVKFSGSAMELPYVCASVLPDGADMGLFGMPGAAIFEPDRWLADPPLGADRQLLATCGVRIWSFVDQLGPVRAFPDADDPLACIPADWPDRDLADLYVRVAK